MELEPSERRGYVYALWKLHRLNLIQYSKRDKSFFKYDRFTENLVIIETGIDYDEILKAVSFFEGKE